MPTRLLLLAILALLISSCGGGDKHLPSSNPPEYDPKKVYSSPNVAPSQSAAQSTKPTELELLQRKLQSLEAASSEKGEWKKVPFNPDSLKLLKGVTSSCEALSRLAQGLGSAQLFAGNEGAALKKALGSEAESIALRLDEQLAEGLKHSLGPGAADCPISVKPRKSSSLKDLPPPARIILARSLSSPPLLLAQANIADTSQDDYHVEKSSSKEDAPPGWVGWKTTDTMTRIGKKPHTEGIRERYEMAIAPTAMQCPDPEGVVPGEFQWSFVMMRATTGPDGTHAVLYSRKVDATLKGQVGDDAKVQYVDMDAKILNEHIGTELSYYSGRSKIQARFTIDQKTGLPQEFSNITVSVFTLGEAQSKDAQIVAKLFVLVAFFSGQSYFIAETEWNKPNTCVEITCNPASKQHKLGPNESVAVKTERRTKTEQAVVPARFKEAKELPQEGNGKVSPKEAESTPGAPATFTYQAPAKRVKHSGFRVDVLSRAGTAEGEWEVVPHGLRLRIQHRIADDPASSGGRVGNALFDGAVQFDASLEPMGVWEGESRFAADISVVRPIKVGHVDGPHQSCSGTASQTEDWQLRASMNAKTQSIRLLFGYVTSDESGTGGGRNCGEAKELHIALFGELKQVVMPASSGARKEVSHASISKTREWLTVTVLESPD